MLEAAGDEARKHGGIRQGALPCKHRQGEGERRRRKERFYMQLGEVIRIYRKSKDMTQEEMAKRLGVTAPAVNKWENGNSYPDILLLAPIARLLGISVDTLLSYREELTAAEIQGIIMEVDQRLKEKPYEEALDWAKGVLAEYPNCAQLIWQIAVLFDAQRGLQGRGEEDDEYLRSLYLRALESSDETIRSSAAGSLFSFYMRKGQYEQAEECLEQFSKLDPMHRHYQARLYAETGRTGEAYKAWEEMLFSCYGQASAALQGMYTLAAQEKDREKMHMLASKQEEMAGCFEMGRYYEVSSRLDLATQEQDAESVVAIMQEVLESVEDIGSFCKAALYAHMTFKEVRPEFVTEMRDNLRECFRDESVYGFLKSDERWRELTEKE